MKIFWISYISNVHFKDLGSVITGENIVDMLKNTISQLISLLVTAPEVKEEKISSANVRNTWDYELSGSLVYLFSILYAVKLFRYALWYLG